MNRRILLALLAAVPLVPGCAAKPEISAQTAYVQPDRTRKLDADDPVPMLPERWRDPRHGLQGRTLTVASLDDVTLRHKEVVLTFDDGPMPGKTEKILDTLDAFDVKATFLMVGQMAHAYPAIARKVVARGHTIGSHTYRHRNLRDLGFDAAMTEILKGEHAVQKAAASEPGFFRFPYLADTSRLRAALAARGTVVMDADIDSKDYFKTTPATVTARTMATLRVRGRGIILLHDIHRRTGTMLPSLLAQLRAEGYSVVALRHARPRLPAAVLASAAF